MRADASFHARIRRAMTVLVLRTGHLLAAGSDRVGPGRVVREICDVFPLSGRPVGWTYRPALAI